MQPVPSFIEPLGELADTCDPAPLEDNAGWKVRLDAGLFLFWCTHGQIFWSCAIKVYFNGIASKSLGEATKRKSCRKRLWALPANERTKRQQRRVRSRNTIAYIFWLCVNFWKPSKTWASLDEIVGKHMSIASHANWHNFMASHELGQSKQVQTPFTDDRAISV